MINKKLTLYLIVFLLWSNSSVTTIAKASESPSSVNHCRLDIVIDMERSVLRGVLEVSTDDEREITIFRNDLEISKITIDGEPTEVDSYSDEETITLNAGKLFRIEYKVLLSDTEDNHVSPEEIILKDGWYPLVEGFSTYEVHAILPPGFIALSEGNQAYTIQQEKNALFFSRFDVPYSDVITFISSKNLSVSCDYLGDTEICTYFFKEDASQSKKYISWAKYYLNLYESLLGKYPYRRFSIVENSLPSAFSMPTFILMTKKYIKEDNIAETPLGHEIAHQWFGNSVFANYEKGNWNEGLTIYFADHLYEQLRGEDANCRKRILIGYENYVHDKNTFPLSKFMERFDYTSRSIGYGKSAMVFHMLRRQYGDETFMNTIRHFIKAHTFKIASWDDLQKTFERVTGDNLTHYFQQWVYDVGVPTLDIANLKIKQKEKNYEVTFSLLQQGTRYHLFIPLTFYLGEEKQIKFVTLSKQEDHFSFVFKEVPKEIVIDENYDIFRKLTVKEIPPSIERLITDEKTIIVAPLSERNIYSDLIDFFSKKGGITKFINQKPDVTQRRYFPKNIQPKPLKDLTTGGPYWREHTKEMGPSLFREGKHYLQMGDARLKETDLASASLLVLGTKNPILRRLKIEPPQIDTDFGVVVKKNPLNEHKVVVIVAGKSQEEIARSQRQIMDYRKYSILKFNQGRLSEKLISPSEKGVRKKVDFMSN